MATKMRILNVPTLRAELGLGPDDPVRLSAIRDWAKQRLSLLTDPREADALSALAFNDGPLAYEDQLTDLEAATDRLAEQEAEITRLKAELAEALKAQTAPKAQWLAHLKAAGIKLDQPGGPEQFVADALRLGLTVRLAGEWTGLAEVEILALEKLVEDKGGGGPGEEDK